MSLTTREAAERLGVSPARVRALVNAGNLAARRVGSQWIVDEDSLDRQALLSQAGAVHRPMSTRIAWGAADLADGGRAPWLSPSERARLRSRLLQARSAETLQRWVERRADERLRLRAGPEDIARLLDTDGVVRTGVSAVESYRLGLGAGGTADAYVAADLVQHLISAHFLVRSSSGNLTLRVVGTGLHADTARRVGPHVVAPRLVVGADLADDPDPRTHSAGLALLRQVKSEALFTRRL